MRFIYLHPRQLYILALIGAILFSFLSPLPVFVPYLLLFALFLLYRLFCARYVQSIEQTYPHGL